MSAGIVFNAQSNVTLRGAGANQTFLVFTGGNGCHGVWADICMDSTDTNWPGGPANTASWTAGYTKGTTTITLSGHTNLTAGQPLILDQADDAADTGSKFVCQSTSLCSLEGNSNNGARSNRDQAQIVQVASCGVSAPGAACTSNTIVITPGLYADNWNSGKSPGAWWSGGPIYGAGVENLSLDNTNSTGNNGFSVWNCQDCWIKGVRSINAGRSHVEVWLSNRVTVRDSYFYGGQGSSSQSYGISPYGSTALLAENNIFQRVTLPLQMNGCAGCVLGYNYAINDYYTPSAGYVNPMIMWHTAGDDLDLAEGNVGAQTYAVWASLNQRIALFRD